MAVHKYTSWGRTRRPKNIAGVDGTAITLESAPTTSATAGYRTENQRFLHVWIDANSGSDTIQIYAFNYAVGKWAKLMVPLGAPASSSGNMDAKTVSNSYVLALLTSSTTESQYIFDIAGIDRVAFVQDGSNTVTVYAACSTF